MATSMLIQSGTVNKTSTGSYSVTFPTAYADTPIVMLTPLWSSAAGSVGSIETVTSITAAGFTATSINTASNYFVQWLAIG